MSDLTLQEKLRLLANNLDWVEGLTPPLSGSDTARVLAIRSQAEQVGNALQALRPYKKSEEGERNEG